MVVQEVAASKRLEAPPDFNGPVKRKCTDVLFALLLLCSWVAMTVIGVDSVNKGNPDVLLNGVDYQGRICGVDAGVESLPKLYYIRFDGTGVCVADCPNATDLNTLFACTDDNAQYALGGSSQLSCSGADASQCADLTGVSDPATFAGSGDGTCMYQLDSLDFVNHCIFYDPVIANQFAALDKYIGYMQQFLGDIYTARNWILGFGFGFSFVLGFVYCLILRIPGVVSLLTWTSILAVIALFAAVGYGFWDLAMKWEDDPSQQHSDTQIIAAKVFGVIGFVLSGLSLLLAMFMYKRIKLAVSIMKEAARAIMAIPLMTLMPVLEAIGMVLFFVPLTYYGVYLASMGDISTDTVAGLEVKTYSYSDALQGRAWYLLFCLFWTTQFIVAMGQIIVALCIVTYYFTRDKSSIGSRTFVKSLFRGMWYHMGTAALGSLIIAIVQMIRAVITYFQKKAKASGNKIAEYALCCCQCCCWCLQKCLQFINKNAYIQTALFSTSFCKSAREAFFLIARNIARVSAVSVVSEFVVIMMKLLICLLTMGATYLGMKETIDDKVYSLVGPTVFVGLLSYLVASVFAELFSMTTSTILQCFIADEEMYPADQRFAQNDLKDWVNSHGSKRAKKNRGVVGAAPAPVQKAVMLGGTS